MFLSLASMERLTNCITHTSGAEFADALKSATLKYHGIAGREFLRKLANDEGDLAELYECANERFYSLLGMALASGQEKRVAAKFALIALAGELATEYGITGWPSDIAFDAAVRAFRNWLTWRGQGNAERQQIVRALAEFLEKHGDSRFTRLDLESHTQSRNSHSEIGRVGITTLARRTKQSERTSLRQLVCVKHCAILIFAARLTCWPS
jgi:uncharacterized protein (DUF927 family)